MRALAGTEVVKSRGAEKTSPIGRSCFKHWRLSHLWDLRFDVNSRPPRRSRKAPCRAPPSYLPEPASATFDRKWATSPRKAPNPRTGRCRSARSLAPCGWNASIPAHTMRHGRAADLPSLDTGMRHVSNTSSGESSMVTDNKISARKRISDRPACCGRRTKMKTVYRCLHISTQLEHKVSDWSPASRLWACGHRGRRTSQAGGPSDVSPGKSEIACPVKVVSIPGKAGNEVTAVIRQPPGSGPFPAILLLKGGLSPDPVERLKEESLTRPNYTRFLASGFIGLSADVSAAARRIRRLATHSMTAWRLPDYGRLWSIRRVLPCSVAAAAQFGKLNLPGGRRA